MGRTTASWIPAATASNSGFLSEDAQELVLAHCEIELVEDHEFIEALGDRDPEPSRGVPDSRENATSSFALKPLHFRASGTADAAAALAGSG